MPSSRSGHIFGKDFAISDRAKTICNSSYLGFFFFFKFASQIKGLIWMVAADGLGQVSNGKRRLWSETAFFNVGALGRILPNDGGGCRDWRAQRSRVHCGLVQFLHLRDKGRLYHARAKNR